MRINDFLLVLKYWAINPLDNFITMRTICCPKCHKAWHQFKKYKMGQNTLCRSCRKNKTIDTSVPDRWTLSWSGTIELGFPDGKYLPRKAALLLHPEYFKDGEPILDMLPMDRPGMK